MKEIYDLMHLAWKLGLKITEIELTKEQVEEAFTHVRLDVKKLKKLVYVETPFGKVRIKIS